MGKKLYPSNVLREALRARAAWGEIDEALVVGGLTMNGLAAIIEEIYQNQHDLAALNAQLTEARNRRDRLYLSAWDQVKRLRAGVKGMYGDDSSEYEVVGGTRRSERNKAPRTQPAEVQETTSFDTTEQ